MRLILGVDTSNYTTSLCAVAEDDGRLIADARRLLPVAKGNKGLRQSDALFFHVQRLPEMMHLLMNQIRDTTEESVDWCGVGVSVRPRPFATSYMPVFLAGLGFAESFATALGIPLLRTTHQEGHIAAAEQFVEAPKDRPYLGVHLSGGTSDVLYIRQTRFGYAVETLGEGGDLHAGQFVDRVGVALGLSFPAGPALEQLAAQAPPDHDFRLPSRALGASLSFSGPCSAALRALAQGVPGEVVASAVQMCIATAVVKAVAHAADTHPDVTDCVIAGGVASNQYIQARVAHRLRVIRPNLNILFAPPRYASDNALGVASIIRRFLLTKA